MDIPDVQICMVSGYSQHGLTLFARSHQRIWFIRWEVLGDEVGV